MITIQQIVQWFNEIPSQYIWIVDICTILIGVFALHVVLRFIYKRLMPRLQKSRRMWDDAIVYAFYKPFIFLLYVIGITTAINFEKNISKHLPLVNALGTIQQISIIIFFVWFFNRFFKQLAQRLVHPDYKKEPLDKTTVDAATKLITLSLFVLAFLVSLQAFGIPISGVLAFGGGGALVAGLAAKDLLANFFGGFMIYMDRPFSVGDWISSPDKEIEGTVEYIGWRLTRIRTFDKRPLYVPNSIFSTVAIINPSRMSNRRIREVFGIRYCDAPKLPAIVADIEDMLRNHPEIDTRVTLMCKLIHLGDSSLDILVYTFTKTTQWVKFQAIQEDVFLKIVDIIFNKHHAEVSPTTYYLDMRGGLPLEIAGYPPKPTNNKKIKGKSDE